MSPRRTMMPMQTAMMPAFALTLGLTRCARRRSCFLQSHWKRSRSTGSPFLGKANCQQKMVFHMVRLLSFCFEAHHYGYICLRIDPCCQQDGTFHVATCDVSLNLCKAFTCSFQEVQSNSELTIYCNCMKS